MDVGGSRGSTATARCRLIATALVLAAAVCMSGSETLAGITVYVDRRAPGPENGRSWCSAFTDLQTALQVAEDNVDLVTEIRVAPGVYTPAGPGGLRTTSFLLPTRNVAILGGYAGCGAPDPDERKLGVYHSILSGDLNGDDFSGGDMSDNAYHVVFAGNTTSTIILDGFVIEGGNANSVDNPNERGGGIFVFFTAANPTIRNCIIRRNTASAKGGGMYAASMTGLLINCVFTGNWAPDGGAIFNVNGNMELVNCTFSGNTATHNGGGIYLASPDALVLTNSVLWGNSDGGGMDESAQINLVGRPVVATYNCIQGWTGQHPGVGNFGDDPMFTDADGGDNLPGTGDDDLRLLLGSPCINSGDPSFTPFGSTDLAGVARVLCGRIDRGAYESGLGDIDCDGSVDMSDFSVWSDCMTGPEVAGLLDGCEPFDFTGDGCVTLDDFAAFQIAFSPAAR